MQTISNLKKEILQHANFIQVGAKELRYTLTVKIFRKALRIISAITQLLNYRENVICTSFVKFYLVFTKDKGFV